MREMCRHMSSVTCLLARMSVLRRAMWAHPSRRSSLLAHEGTAYSCMSETFAHEQSIRARNVGIHVPNEQAPRA